MNTCSVCNGSGIMPCPDCGGTGINPKQEPDIETGAISLGLPAAGDSCTKCSGTGEMRCAKCSGTGMEPGAVRR